MKMKNNIEVTNTTLVITDPCYIKKVNPLMEESTIYGDWSCMVYPGKLGESNLPNEWVKHYMEFFMKCNIATTEEEKAPVREEWIKFKEEWKKHILGEFCADSGRVAIFDWNSLSEKDKQWVTEHPWCAAIIHDFTGTVKFYDSNEETRHIIGEGDKPFYSVQSGL